MPAELRVFLSGMRISFAMYAVEMNPSVLFGSKIPRAVLQALFFVLMAKAAGGDELARFALIGNAVHAAVFPAVIFMADVIDLEKWAGTIPHLIAAPGSWLPVLVGRSAATFADAIFGTLIVVGILVPTMARDITFVNLLRAVPLLLLTIASVTGLGWMIGSVSLPTRWGNTVGNMMGYIMMVLCGVNFPITALPPVFTLIGRLLPMTHGTLAMRAVIDGASYASVLPLIGTELAIGVVYGAAAWLVFAWRLQIARQTGALEQM